MEKIYSRLNICSKKIAVFLIRKKSKTLRTAFSSENIPPSAHCWQKCVFSGRALTQEGLWFIIFLSLLHKGTIVQPTTVEWPSQQQQIRISSQEALLDPSGGGGSNQLLIESAGGQLMHHEWPLPQRTQFASVMGGTLGRHPAVMNPAAASRVPNLQYPNSTSTFRATAGYPLYHTCERPPPSKKRVTIVEDNNTESSV